MSNPKSPTSIIEVCNIKPTKSHYHKKFIEIYWVRNGEITVTINNEERFDLKKDDSLVIEPRETHKVSEASEKNNVIVLCSPPYDLSDEYLE